MTEATRHLLASALVMAVASATSTVDADEITTYGEPLTLATPVRISELLDDPERYLGQAVRVEGLIEDVCPMKGCWIDILEQQSAKTIRFKVEDDVISFPVAAKGNAVVAEGVLRKRELSREQAAAWMRHHAEEKGEPFDDTSVTGPMTLYEIEGAGAEVSRPAVPVEPS